MHLSIVLNRLLLLSINRWAGYWLEVEQEVINNLLFYFIGHNNDLLVESNGKVH